MRREVYDFELKDCSIAVPQELDHTNNATSQRCTYALL